MRFFFPPYLVHQHCASDAHQAAVAADPFFKILLELTRSDQAFHEGKGVTDVDKGDSPLESMNMGEGGECEMDAIMVRREVNRRTISGRFPHRMTTLTREVIPQRSPPRDCQSVDSKIILWCNEKEGRGEEEFYRRGQSPEGQLVEAPVCCEPGAMSPAGRRTAEKDSYDTMGKRIGSVPGSETHGCGSHHVGEAETNVSIYQSAQCVQSPENPLVETPVRCKPSNTSPARHRSTENISCDTREDRVGSVPVSENHVCDPHIDGAGMKSSVPQSGQRGRPSEDPLVEAPIRGEPDDMSRIGHRSTKKGSCATKEARVGSVTLTDNYYCDSNPGGEGGTKASTPQLGPVVITPAEAKTNDGVLVESCKMRFDDLGAEGKASPSGIPSTINTPGIHPNTPHSTRRGRKQCREIRMLADTPEFISAQERRGSSARRALRCKRRDNVEPYDIEGNRLLNATGYGEDTATANSEAAQGDASEHSSNSHDIRARATPFVDHRAKRKDRKAAQSSSRRNSNGSKRSRRDQSNVFPERGNVSSSASATIEASLSSEEKRRKGDSSTGKTSVSLGIDAGYVAGGNTDAASNEVRVPDEG